MKGRRRIVARPRLRFWKVLSWMFMESRSALVSSPPPISSVFFIQGKDADVRLKELLETFDGRALFRRALPAVLVVHIENQVDGFAFLQHADEQNAGEEGLAGAALAEDAVGALDELLQVEAELGLHVQRVADIESLLVLAAEDELHIPLRSQVDHGEVTGHGLDGLGAFERAHA